MIEARDVPLIAAPMAGGITTPELVAAVGAEGGFGFLASGYLSDAALHEQITRTKRLGDAPFGVNLFVPGPRHPGDLAEYRRELESDAARYGVSPGEPRWDDDQYQAKVELVIAERVPVVSFTFGAPEPVTVRRLHEVGTEVVVTVTSPDEARHAAAIGADALCVQGAEAGGHRAVFSDDGTSPAGGPLYGLLAALALLRSRVALPLIAAGGLVSGADVAAVLSAGAVAAQLGTAFMVCTEAGTHATQYEQLLTGSRETALTRSFSGRPARGLVNRFMTEHTETAPAAYPELHHLTKPIRGASGQADDPEAMSLWAGQTYSLVEPMPAGNLVRKLHADARTALEAAADRLDRDV